MNNRIVKQEYAGVMLGVEGRYFNVVTADNGRILNQTFKATRRYTEGKNTYQHTVGVRFDDECRNGHETFSITSDIRENGREYMGGCCHDEIAVRFPELAPLIKWHLTSTDGPIHYLANTLYHAGNRDHNGLLEGETRQIRNGRTGQLCWKLDTGKAEQYIDSDVQPQSPTAKYVPWNTIGEGKKREFDHARSSAVWPEATDEQLSLPKAELEQILKARHQSLVAAFKAAMLGAGFVWPEITEQVTS